NSPILMDFHSISLPEYDVLKLSYTYTYACTCTYTSVWTCPDFVDTSLSCSRIERQLNVVLIRRHVVEAGMQSLPVIPHLDVVEQGGHCFLACVPVFLLDEFPLQCGEEALCNGVIPAVSASAHTCYQTV